MKRVLFRIFQAASTVLMVLLLTAACGSMAPHGGEEDAAAEPAATVAAEAATAASGKTASYAAVASASGQETEYTGYLIDQKCGLQQEGKMKMHMKHADYSKNPELHPNMCNKMPSCSGDGYGLSIKQEDGTWKFFKFDESGSELAAKQVVEVTDKTDNLLVKVKGNLSGDILTITSITEQ